MGSKFVRMQVDVQIREQVICGRTNGASASQRIHIPSRRVPMICCVSLNEPQLLLRSERDYGVLQAERRADQLLE